MNKHRAYKYRFYPTPEQEQNLAKTFGCVRFVYNRMLFYRQQAYYQHHEKLSYVDTAFLLTNLKNQDEYQWLNEVSSVPLQQSLRHLQTAYQNFFAGRAKYPTFKKKQSRQSATYASSAFTWRDGKLKLAKHSEPLNIRWSREFSGNPSTVTVSKDAAGRYFVSILVEEDIRPLPVSKGMVGIDLGLTHFAITSDGVKVDSPKYFKKHEQRLALLQRRLSRKAKGSKNREKAKRKVAKLHAKIADSRRDFHHKLSTQLIRENQFIAVETLTVKNMVKHPTLAKAISDSGWSQFLSFLSYKAEWYGRTLAGIDRWYPSSKRCSCCGHTVSSMPLEVREWRCPSCNETHDRDVNAARNILAVGLTVSACGESVSRVDSISACCSQ